MRNNKYKNKAEKEEEDVATKRGYIYLVKNPASNEMTLCAYNHTLKRDQGVVYETRYGQDLGFVVGDASKLGQPYKGGNLNPCGACSCPALDAKNIEAEEKDEELVSFADYMENEFDSSDEGSQKITEKITQEIKEIYSDVVEQEVIPEISPKDEVVNDEIIDDEIINEEINDDEIIKDEIKIDQSLESEIKVDEEEIEKEIEEEEELDKEIFLFRDTSNTANCNDDGCDKVVVSDDAVWIERLASVDDIKKYKELSLRENDALTLCREKIKKHKLEMKLVTAHFLLVEPKVVFFFTADVRVDFRELVKDLVGIFRIRIELRQIGVRDESRLLGGLAVCGRDYCCHGITDKLLPVSIKMAKEQNLSLNSIKISGPCGRLLCCLAYEQDFYTEEKLKYPSEGSRIKIGRDLYRVSEVNIISRKILLQSSEGGMMSIDATHVYYNSDSSFWVLEKEYMKELLSE
jgi:cell fate regulator YaaT (PSP1 superfamily)